MNDLVSVIVPIYNIEKYVKECIESICKQTYMNLEIILVNDGSTDGSKAICEYYSRIDSRIVLINKPNGGLVSARKAGIMRSKGAYISCVDGDDWVESRYIENMYKETQMKNIDIVIAGFRRNLDGVSVNILNNIKLGEYSKDEIRNILSLNLINNGVFFEFGIYSYLWNKLFKKSSIINFQLAVPDKIFIGEDSACVFPAILNSSRIKIINSTDYNYRQRPNSMLKKESNFKEEISTFSLLFKHLKKMLLIKDNPELTEILVKQIKELVSGLMIIRTGGFIEYENETIFSLFDKIDITQSIGIYSAGTFGQHVYRRLKYNLNAEMVKLYDPDYKQYNEHGLDVVNSDNIHNNCHDYVIICSLSNAYIENVSKFLLEKGYNEKQIISLNSKTVDVNKITSYL